MKLLDKFSFGRSAGRSYAFCDDYGKCCKFNSDPCLTVLQSFYIYARELLQSVFHPITKANIM